MAWHWRQARGLGGACAIALFTASSVLAQDATGIQHDHAQMNMAGAGWQFMQDAVVFAEFNHQGAPRGGNEFVAPNWWMGMASRNTPRGQLTFTSMLSLDPAAVGKDGYREIFQAGEALNGRPLIDRQHPHDFFMQLAAVWRVPVTRSTGFTVAGGPVGEPALGPVAFMHRASAANNPTAPLGHHTFDSTHVAFGVVNAVVDHGPWVVEGSIFNGREPDEHRWDFDFGRLDSYSGRVWYRPTKEWEVQFSSGHLKSPEALDPGNIVRSTASASWTRRMNGSITSVTSALGRNNTDHGSRNAFFAEGSRQAGPNSLYGRFEAVQTEAFVLAAGQVPEHVPADNHRDAVLAFTVGGLRDVLAWRGFEGGIGADVTFYGVPAVLQPLYTSHPVSLHVFFRLRPSAGAMRRMWNMRMSQPMAGHQETWNIDTPQDLQHSTDVTFAHRLASLATLIALLGGNAGLCADWDARPEARMTCCSEAGACPMHKSDRHGSGSRTMASQADADRCCAVSGRGSSPSSTSDLTSALAGIPPATVLLTAALIPPPAPIRHARAAVPVSPVPKHLLLSVLLV